MLDLTTFGSRRGEPAAIYDQIAGEVRLDFANFIGTLAPVASYALDWWVEAPASRNPVFSRLFHQIVSLLTIQRCIPIGELPREILVDDQVMARLVRQIISASGDAAIVRTIPLHQRSLTKLRNMLSPWRSMARLLVEWLVVRRGRKDAVQIAATASANGLILVDTFAIPSFVDTDRYYPDLYEMSGDAQLHLRFVPQFFNMSIDQLKQAVITLRRKPEQYLIKEDYIGLGDLLWCFGHYWRIRMCLPQHAMFRGLDLAELVRVDIKRHHAFRCALRGLLNFRLAKSLREANIQINKTIDWFENHPMDRGWNCGFNRYFPEANRVGYTGFFPAGQSYRPTSHEAAAKVLPPQHLVIGAGFKADLCEFTDDLVVDVAPAFRYRQLPPLSQIKPEFGRVLVAMPYYPDMCLQVLEVVYDLQNQNPDWQFVLKAHPATPLSGFELSQQILDANAEESELAIHDLLINCMLMITGAQASTIIESVACGVPTLLVTATNGASEVAIPNAVPASMYQVCSHVDNATSHINRLFPAGQSHDKERLSSARLFRERCFTPVTSTTIRQLLAA